MMSRLQHLYRRQPAHGFVEAGRSFPTLRNVSDLEYWITNVYGSFYESKPRTLWLSAAMDF